MEFKNGRLQLLITDEKSQPSNKLAITRYSGMRGALTFVYDTLVHPENFILALLLAACMYSE